MVWFRARGRAPVEKPNLLLRSQRNDVFLVLQNHQLEPVIANFRWVEARFKTKTQDDWYSALVYREDDFWPYYFPNAKLGYTQVLWYKKHHRDWRELLQDVAIWARAVAAQVLVPDYWDTPAAVASQLFGDLSRDDSVKAFSREEIEKIRHATNEYRRQLAAKYRITPEQASEIDRHLAYLVREAESQTRQAWFHTAIGVMVTIAAIIQPAAGVLAGTLALFASLFGAFGNRKQLGP